MDMYVKIKNICVDTKNNIYDFFKNLSDKTKFYFKLVSLFISFYLMATQYISLSILLNFYLLNVLIDSIKYTSNKNTVDKEQENIDSTYLVNRWITYAGLLFVSKIIDYSIVLLNTTATTLLFELLRLMMYYNLMESDKINYFMNDKIIKFYVLNGYAIELFQSLGIYITTYIKEAYHRNYLNDVYEYFNKKLQ